MNGFGTTAACTLVVGAVVVLAALLCVGMARGEPVQAAGASAFGVPVEAAAADRSFVLADVSCRAANSCIAVGNDNSASGQGARPLAEAWNGAAWAITRTRVPARATAGWLRSVSCHAASDCMAVGDYETRADPGGRPLAQRWDGTTWRVTSVPRPSGGGVSGLTSVSCGSAHVCVAVGFAIRNGHNNAFAAVWHGGRWTLKPARRPDGATYSSLGDVSCPAPRACVAVGSYQVNESSKSRTLAEAWNGRTWTMRRTPNPRSGANGSELEGVSCSSANACMAVGHRVKRSNTGLLTLAERWNGRRWTLTNSRNQDASGGSHLAAVSCPATRTCLAVGTAFSSNPVRDGNDSIAEAWSGNTWSLSPAPAPQDAASTSLEQVSCRSAARCMAIGHYYTTADPSGMTTPLGIPMALVWNGAWAIAAAP